MPLTAGTRLGPYEIVDKLGQGGMGEVYRANDTRLDRTVAIKVLPEILADNPELKERFEREAKAVSSLNHPNICTLYDVHLRQGSGGQVGGADDIDYLVMEHLEGDNLAETLSSGPLPLQQALAIGAQIADALDKAHRQGVVHRDLKPANVVLTKQGAKLLDFGLAKQLEGSSLSGGSELSALPTEAQPLTREGTLLGTFQYMAPEQLEGKAVTAQSDIFALGAVLFEMVTGQRAFKGGGSTASIISVIMTAEPPAPSSLQPGASPALDALIQGCLAKDPEERWQSAGDVARQLKFFATGTQPSTVATPNPAPATATAHTANNDTTSRVPLILVGLLAGVIGAGAAAWWLSPPPPDLLPAKLSATVPPSEPLRGNLALSPDGGTLMWVGFRDDEQLLFRRNLTEWDAVAIRGTEGASSHAVSPDGEWVAFFTLGTIKKASLAGGAAVTLCEACAASAGIGWGLDGITVSSPGGLFLVPEAGGPPALLLSREKGLDNYIESHPLPGSRNLLFSEGGIAYAVDLETQQRHAIGEGRGPKYSESGHVVFERAGTLWAVPFDPERLETLGDPVPVVENVLVNENGFPRFALSQTGTLAYLPARSIGSTVVAVDAADAGIRELVSDLDGSLFPRLSPDGQRLAVAIANETSRQDVWVIDLERGTKTRIVKEGSNEFPAWMPDGERLSFISREVSGGTNRVYVVNADGTGEPEELVIANERLTTLSWHPDGKILAIEWMRDNALFDIALRADNGTTSFLEETEFNETAPAFSPDGQYLAYVSDESGTPEVYVRAFPGPGKWTISRGGGGEPVWSRDGTTLFYRQRGEMWSVPVQIGPDFRPGAERFLFDRPFGVRSGALQTTANYDVGRDGDGFVMLQSGGRRAHRGAGDPELWRRAEAAGPNRQLSGRSYSLGIAVSSSQTVLFFRPRARESDAASMDLLFLYRNLGVRRSVPERVRRPNHRRSL